MKENKELEREINQKKENEKSENFSKNESSESLEKTEERELSSKEINALIEQFTTKQNQRFLQFLRENTSSIDFAEGFLMKSLESGVENSPKQNQKNEKEDKLDYVKYEDPEKSKYKSYSPANSEVRDAFEEKSSSERIMDEQKRVTKSVFGGGYGKEENEDKYLKPEDIKIDKIRKYFS